MRLVILIHSSAHQQNVNQTDQKQDQVAMAKRRHPVDALLQIVRVVRLLAHQAAPLVADQPDNKGILKTLRFTRRVLAFKQLLYFMAGII